MERRRRQLKVALGALFTPPAPGHRHPLARRTFDEWLVDQQLPAPEREYPFAAPRGRKWAFDYAWPHYRIAFEREGSVFGRKVTVLYDDGTTGTERVGGRHNAGVGFEKDCEKYNTAAVLGWCVIRGTTTMIRDGHVQPQLLEAFTARGWRVPP